MWLASLPDLDRPVEGEGFRLLRPFGRGEPFRLVPTRLELDVRPGGLPDLQLRIFRPLHPGVPPEPYGLLDLRLRIGLEAEAALAAARQIEPRARLEAVPVRDAVLRLVPTGELADGAADLAEPLALALDGLGGARYTRRLSLSSALFVRRLLEEEGLPLLARCEMSIAGVAPRLPVTVRLDPRRPLEGLRDALGAERPPTREALAGRLEADPGRLGLVFEPGPLPPAGFGEVMADWVRARLGAAAGAVGGVDGAPRQLRPPGRLASPESIAAGRWRWDLSRPVVGWRAIELDFDPFLAARRSLAAGGFEAVVPPPVVVPPMPTGLTAVELSANLPAERPRVLSVGATIEAPPQPPARPQAVIATVELQPPDDVASLALRLAPAEEPAWQVSTFVLLDHPHGPRRLVGPSHRVRGGRVRLEPDHFPVLFVPVEASAALLGQATVEVLCRWQGGEDRALLAAGSRAVLLAVERDAADARLEVEARPLDRGSTLRLGPLPPLPLSLDLVSFPEYGPQRVVVEGRFEDGSDLLAVDLQPEGAEGGDDEVAVLALTPRAPLKEWTYLARSPFRSGYRFRPHAPAGEPARPWSAWRAPDERLVVDAAGSGR